MNMGWEVWKMRKGQIEETRCRELGKIMENYKWWSKGNDGKSGVAK